MDLRGKTFGYWTVLPDEPKYAAVDSSIMYRCRCVCGTERWVRGINLTTNGSRSCGCMSHANTRQPVKITASMERDLTEFERTVVILYNEGRTIAEISETVHKSKPVIRATLDKAGVDRSQLGHRAPLSEDTRNTIIRLYKSGEWQYKISQNLGISNSTVRDVLSRAGLLLSSYTTKFPDAIRPIDILEKRMSMHEGDEMLIPTMKTGGNKTCSQQVDTAMRQAVVVNTDNSHFCIFRLKNSGVIDCVNWIDLVMMDRFKEKARVKEE